MPLKKWEKEIIRVKMGICKNLFIKYSKADEWRVHTKLSQKMVKAAIKICVQVSDTTGDV